MTGLDGSLADLPLKKAWPRHKEGDVLIGLVESSVLSSLSSTSINCSRDDKDGNIRGLGISKGITSPSEGLKFSSCISLLYSNGSSLGVEVGSSSGSLALVLEPDEAGIIRDLEGNWEAGIGETVLEDGTIIKELEGAVLHGGLAVLCCDDPGGVLEDSGLHRCGDHLGDLVIRKVEGVLEDIVGSDPIGQVATPHAGLSSRGRADDVARCGAVVLGHVGGVVDKLLSHRDNLVVGAHDRRGGAEGSSAVPSVAVDPVDHGSSVVAIPYLVEVGGELVGGIFLAAAVRVAGLLLGCEEISHSSARGSSNHVIGRMLISPGHNPALGSDELKDGVDLDTLMGPDREASGIDREGSRVDPIPSTRATAEPVGDILVQGLVEVSLSPRVASRAAARGAVGWTRGVVRPCLGVGARP